MSLRLQARRRSVFFTRMDVDDDVPLILTWDEANSGLLNEEAERGDESKCSCLSVYVNNMVLVLTWHVVMVN